VPPSLQHVFYTDMGWQSRAWTDKLTHPAKARVWGVFRLETKKNPKMRGRAKKEGLGPAGDRDSARAQENMKLKANSPKIVVVVVAFPDMV
jgi:hypothetical protein